MRRIRKLRHLLLRLLARGSPVRMLHCVQQPLLTLRFRGRCRFCLDTMRRPHPDLIFAYRTRCYRHRYFERLDLLSKRSRSPGVGALYPGSVIPILGGALAAFIRRFATVGFVPGQGTNPVSDGLLLPVFIAAPRLPWLRAWAVVLAFGLGAVREPAAAGFGCFAAVAIANSPPAGGPLRAGFGCAGVEG